MSNSFLFGLIGFALLGLMIWIGADFIRIGDDSVTLSTADRFVVIVAILLAWLIAQVVFLSSVKVKSKKYLSGRQNPQKPSTLDVLVHPLPQELLTVINDLNRRARKLSFVNYLILVFIVLVLLGAAAFIVVAGEIASKDTESLSSIQSMANDLKEEEYVLDQLQGDRLGLINRIENIRNPPKQGETSKQQDPELSEVGRLLRSMPEFQYSLKYLESKLTTLDEEIDFRKRELWQRPTG